jgi:hypothetical protein
MDWEGMLILIGFLVLVTALVVAGTWWQLWVSGKIGKWGSRRFENLDPETQAKLGSRLRRVPGRKGLNRATRDASREAQSKRESWRSIQPRRIAAWDFRAS